MSNDNVIRAALNSILAPHDAAWLKLFVEQYVAIAHQQVVEFSKDLTSAKLGQRVSRPRFVAFKGEEPFHYEDRLAALAAGLYVANIEAATKDAETSYQETREAFIVHAAGKIGYACQGVDLSAATFQGEISLHGLIEGYLNVSFGSTSFRVTLSIKTNYRYGSNAANGRLTVYSQYPLRFVYAVVNGEQLSGVLGEEVLANKISGLPIDHKERTARAVIDAKNEKRAEKRKLDDQKDALNRVAGEYGSIEYWQSCKAEPGADAEHLDRICAEAKAKIDALCAKHGLPIPASKKAALAAAKSTLAAIRAIGSVK